MSQFEVPLESRVRYLKRRLDELQKLADLLALENHEQAFELAKKMGHQIKGNALNFGFDALAPVGHSLETAAAKSSSQAVIEWKAQLEKQIQILLSQFSG